MSFCLHSTKLWCLYSCNKVFMIVVTVTGLTGHIRRTYKASVFDTVGSEHNEQVEGKDISFLWISLSSHLFLPALCETDTLWPYTVSCTNIARFTGNCSSNNDYDHMVIMKFIPCYWWALSLKHPSGIWSSEAHIQFITWRMNENVRNWIFSSLTQHQLRHIEAFLSRDGDGGRGNSPAAITHSRTSACSKFSPH